MFKKSWCIFIFTIVIMLCSFTASAAPAGDTDKDTPQEVKHLIMITRPDDDGDKTFNKTYMICGITTTDDVKIGIKLQKKNKEGKFEPFEDVDGRSSWVVGPSGIFAKEVKLDTGNNVFRVVAYYYDKSRPEYEDPHEITITLLDINKVKELKTKILDNIFNPLKK